MDKELIEHIATELQNHEENYSPGAWERFAEKEEKKRRGFILWPLWIAAAVILIFGSLFLFNPENKLINNVAKTGKKDVKQAIKSETPDHTTAIPPVSENIIASTGSNNVHKRQPLNRYASQPNENNNIILNPANQINDVALANNSTLINNIAGINLYAPTNKSFEIISKDKAVATKKISFEDLLAQDSKAGEQQNLANNSAPVSKWKQDVYVAPAMGNDNKVNMNYGFSLSYEIGRKLSISSGVSYASLSSSESQGQVNNMDMQSLSAKNLESIQAKVRGINIPLEITYQINDNLYTGIGVSALAVLNNSQQNTYIVNQVQSMPAATTTGTYEQKNFIVKEKTSEPQPESTLDPDKYIGFYNFSLGYKQKVSKKNNIAIEPFLRLPMKTFTKENLNLTNGGLRLKFDF